MATTKKRRGDEHLSREQVELYSLGRLTEQIYAEVEAHLGRCNACRADVDLDMAIIDTIREALVAELWQQTHRTQGGTIDLLVLYAGQGFTGRIVGDKIDAGKTCSTFEDAQQWCQKAFAEMFPEHRCGLGCTSHSRTFGTVR